MNDHQADAPIDVGPPGARSPSRAKASRTGLLVLVAVALVTSIVQWQLLSGRREAAPAVLSLHPQPLEMPPLRFTDENGVPTSLQAFRGRVVLLNVWATWCAPCVKEMPALDRLQAALEGQAFEVVTLSIDTEGLSAVWPFFTRLGISHLRPYVDSFHEASDSLSASGIPITLLIDQDGREIARKIGVAPWNAPEMVQLFRSRLLAPTAEASAPGGTIERHR